MQKHLRVLAIALFAGSLSVSATAQETPEITGDTVVASVNGVEITIGHMIAARATLDDRFANVPPADLYNGILTQLIQQTALAENIQELPPLVALTLENEERSLKAGEFLNTALATAVSEEEVVATYDARFGSIDPQEEYNASHILVTTEEEALAVKETLDGGADFAATARTNSTGPSGPNGGELGWFSSGMMVPSFEAATIALSVGEVSEPVETQFGWHVIRLNDTRSKPVPSLDEVRPQILDELRNEAAQQMVNSAADGMDVVIPEIEGIDPEILTQIDLLAQ
ncbi:MAG: peptidylprolyl isomerase [Roseobacter sp.]|jgi:peptidyl-prolyl cis-trans isomerase C|nr:peptidylprolyl isomerase [Roseobacter sp.]